MFGGVFVLTLPLYMSEHAQDADDTGDWCVLLLMITVDA